MFGDLFAPSLDGEFSAVSRETGIKAFLASFASHIETIAAIRED